MPLLPRVARLMLSMSVDIDYHYLLRHYARRHYAERDVPPPLIALLHATLFDCR